MNFRLTYFRPTVAGIPRSTAYESINGFNVIAGTVLPGNNLRETNNKAKKLFPEHSAFLVSLFDDNPSIVLEEVKLRLCISGSHNIYLWAKSFH